MKKVAEMNGTEKIAYRNIKAGFNYEVGGWYNCIQDNCIEYIPDTAEEAMEYLYEEVINNAYDIGYCGYGKAPREMRFAGTEFIRECLEYLFNKDEDIAEIKEVKNW